MKRHIEYCCRVHGCMLGEPHNCDIWLGYEEQLYLCTDCISSFDGAEIISDIPTVSIEEFHERRLAASDD